jgi:hypothetical protein
VSYRLEGYVPYTSESTEVREDGQLVTVSLSRMLEATESSGREVRIILNWGSRPDQVKDADSHVACPCGSGLGHVYFQNRTHEEPEHEVELDVDDTDWGGPETITLTRPVPGTYVYWVHDFSGPPATLGASDVVVHVVIGSHEAGEFRVFKGAGVARAIPVPDPLPARRHRLRALREGPPPEPRFSPPSRSWRCWRRSYPGGSWPIRTSPVTCAARNTRRSLPTANENAALGPNRRQGLRCAWNTASGSPRGRFVAGSMAWAQTQGKPSRFATK